MPKKETSSKPWVVPSYIDVPLDHIAESPLNPRKTFHAIETLAEDIARNGVLQPILLRPLKEPERFEIVFGTRRFRAAKIAGLQTIPAGIRAIPDSKALELQIVENVHREDIHPLEEAEGYGMLHDTMGYSAEDLAVKVGKSKSWIYQRLKLLALCPKARKAFLKGDISPSIAILIARIPSPVLQVEALEAITGGWRGVMNTREATRFILDQYTLRLKDAKFNRKDADLVPDAGACTSCAHRTGNQPELFADIASADVCTRPSCFHQKTAAQGRAVISKLRAAGATILSDKEMKRLFPYGGRHISSQSGFVELDDRCYSDAKTRTYRQIIKGGDIAIMAGIMDDGSVIELMRARDLRPLLQKAGVQLSSVDPVSIVGRKVDPKLRLKELTRKRMIAILLDNLVEASGGERLSLPIPDAWEPMLALLLDHQWSDTLRLIFKRRGLDWKGSATRRTAMLIKSLDGTPQASFALMLEVLVVRAMASVHAGESLPAPVQRLCTAFRVDPNAAARQARLECKPKPKAKQKDRRDGK